MFEFGRLQGLFSTSKETGYFAISAFILSRVFLKERNILDVALILVAVLSGTRTAIIFLNNMLFGYVPVSCWYVSIMD